MSATRFQSARGWLLGLGEDLTSPSIFDAFHERTRRLYLERLVPRLEIRLRGRTGEPGLRTYPRHSVLSRPGFRAFGSDLDLSLVLDDATDGDLLVRSAVLCAEVRRLRHVLPFLGEVEIYTASEHGLKLSLESDPQLAEILAIIRLLRKWKWQEQALKAAITPYHTRKAKRSMSRILSELAMKGRLSPEERSLGKAADRAIHEHFPPAKALGEITQFRSKYLGWEIADGASLLALTQDSVWKLALVTPDSEIASVDANTLERARHEPAISAVYAGVCAYELLVSRSFERIHGKSSEPGHARWMTHLEDALRHHSPSTPGRGMV